jgi:hypothetical protein
MGAFLDKSTQAFATPSQPLRSKLVKLSGQNPRITIWIDAKISGATAASSRPWRTLFCRGRGNQFLEARIFAQWLKHRIQPEQRRSERRVCGQGRASYGIERSFSNAEMARSGSPTRAAMRARMSSGLGPVSASLQIGNMASAGSAKVSAAALSPRPIFVSVRSPIRTKFSGCCLVRSKEALYWFLLRL